MTSTVYPYTTEQITVWLRGLLTVAWADGHFDDEEKSLIAELTQDELAPQIELGTFEPIAPNDLAATLLPNAHAAENFLRTAVMVAIADGIYSETEDTILLQFCTALNQPSTILDSLRQTLDYASPISGNANASAIAPSADDSGEQLPVLTPVKEWLDGLEVHDPRVARFLCKMIPPQCPFERDVVLFGRKLVHIPAMCKLNPLYDQLVGLRFRALSYLADDCGEDVTPYLGG
ncbi:MAG: nitrogenase [Leptolyngbyaceae cyanobacterium SL_7_1]|nr:nitrogenase [Leptolyngbyaceae cyanobacterium SL_7_1]